MKTITLIFLFIASFVNVLSNTRDSRVREYITPKRIVWVSNEQNIKNSQVLLLDGKGQSDLLDNNVCNMISKDGECASVLLDFGKEIQGGIQIVTGQSKGPVNVRIRFGESVGEAMSELGNKNSSNAHAIRDFKAVLPNLGVAELGNSGFRFVRIDLLSDNVDFHLKEVRAVSVFRDIPYKGTFRCSDKCLDEIWKTGAYTVHLNMQEYLWDGIKRDRLVWVGDMHPEVMTINTVFGYNEVVPKSLDMIRNLTKLPSWMNNIASYSIWWLLIQKDWYMYQGDIEYLKKQKSYILSLLSLLMENVGDVGIEKIKGRKFLDWPSNKHSKAINAGHQSLMIMAMNAGYELCMVLGEDELAEKCKTLSDKMLKSSNPVKQEYLNSGKRITDPGHKQGAALMSLAGIMDPAEADRNIISVEGAKGFSTFYGYYMLKAMAKAGNYQGAVDIIREYWGGMLDLGATTFWEDFNLDWIENSSRIDEIVPEGKNDIHGDFGDYCYKGYRHSLCHGWASGPTSWLSEYVLGIKVLEPGCKVVKIESHLCDLDWAEGTFPTPYGIISVKHTKANDGTVKTEFSAPDEIQIIRE